MNRSWYDHEVIRQLSDTLAYIPITHVDALTIIKQVRLAISQILRNPAFPQFLTPSATRYLRQSIEITDDHIVIPTIYILQRFINRLSLVVLFSLPMHGSQSTSHAGSTLNSNH